MSKLFVSYRRKSWGFTHRLADELRERLDAEVFVDVDSIDRPDFETSILSHLRTSDVFLLVVTKLTFAKRIHRDDDWVRHEIREALMLKIPLVMINVDGLLPPSSLPDDIKDIARMQGVKFYPDFFIPAVERLTDFVAKVSTVRRKGITSAANITLEPMTLMATGIVEDPLERHLKHQKLLNTALDLHDSGNHSKAIFLFEELKADGFNSPFVNLDELLADARKHEAIVLRRRNAQVGYSTIVALAKRRVTQRSGLKAFQEWQIEYPDLIDELDTENIRGQSSQLSQTDIFNDTAQKLSETKKRIFTPGEILTQAMIRERNTSAELLPKPFAWINIPEGDVRLITKQGWTPNYISAAAPASFRLPRFEISKYPITNAQFIKFVEAGGYKQTRWWTETGWEERERENWMHARFSDKYLWNKPTNPIVGISWYEALAYCNWLCDVTEEIITLPTEQQWQRAAQGETNWKYPYGDTFNESCCNFNTESTSEVRKYSGKDKGDSPFGVVDMSGNIWEWCVTDYRTGDRNVEGDGNRVLRGGSWFDSNPEDLQVDLRINVHPSGNTHHWGFRIVRL